MLLDNSLSIGTTSIYLFDERQGEMQVEFGIFMYIYLSVLNRSVARGYKLPIRHSFSILPYCILLVLICGDIHYTQPPKKPFLVSTA